ncbi:MAG: class I SAM-dependent methyltransferase [Clostridiales bacterium]|nr:class I SAM-dependent methyltransferase [Clostridiales bacterium]
MKFYETIAKYYDDIFPLNHAQVNFTKKYAKQFRVQHLLDIGCATGKFAHAMINDVQKINAFDMDQIMVNIAVNRYKDISLEYQIGDMRFLDDLYADMQFDMITCFGNTLVHLSHEDVLETLKGIGKHLSGVFLMQILNYDHIFKENITALPIIDNEKITFIRTYNLDDHKKIGFDTQLILKDTNTTIQNSIWLYPIRKKELNDMLEEAGFSNISFYKNYQEDKADGKHLPLIVKVSKSK